MESWPKLSMTSRAMKKQGWETGVVQSRIDELMSSTCSRWSGSDRLEVRSVFWRECNEEEISITRNLVRM